MKKCAFLTLDQRADFVIDDEHAIGLSMSGLEMLFDAQGIFWTRIWSMAKRRRAAQKGALRAAF